MQKIGSKLLKGYSCFHNSITVQLYRNYTYTLQIPGMNVFSFHVFGEMMHKGNDASSFRGRFNQSKQSVHKRDDSSNAGIYNRYPESATNLPKPGLGIPFLFWCKSTHNYKCPINYT